MFVLFLLLLFYCDFREVYCLMLKFLTLLSFCNNVLFYRMSLHIAIVRILLLYAVVICLMFLFVALLL